MPMFMGAASCRSGYRRPTRNRFYGRPMTPISLLTATVFLAVAAYILLKARWQRWLGGLPEGDIIYSDAAGEDCPVLISKRYGIKGKPDASGTNPVRRTGSRRTQEGSRAAAAL